MTAEKEAEYLFDKNVECPVCDSTFRTRVVKTGRVRRLESDFDLRPRHPDVDTIKYDVVSCPHCGYTALNRFFTELTRGQKMLIREGVCKKFHPAENSDEEEMVRPYSCDKAIDRYKLAFYNAIVKKGRASEKAYICLKISWLYRAQTEQLEAGQSAGAAEKIQTCRQQENAYYKQAYEGFIEAIASENFPMCGMDEHTVNYLVASMAYKLGHMDVASKLVSTILVSRTAGRTVKDRAYDLKEQIIEKLHKE